MIVLIIYILAIVVWAIISLIAMSITALVDLIVGGERRLTLRVSYVVARMIYHLSPAWRVKVEGKENFPTDSRPYVITANHQSFFDIPLMFFLPAGKPFNFVSKIEVRKIPAVGWMLGLRDDIVIRRGPTSAATTVIEQGSRHLKNGTSVMIFPEGTRSKDGEIHLYKEGAFRLAQENGVGIIPCVMSSTRGLLTKRGLARRTLTLQILPTLSAEEVAAQTPREVAKAVQQQSTEALAQMRTSKQN